MRISLPIALLLLASCCAAEEGMMPYCDDPVVDSAFSIGDEIYFFKGENYWIRSDYKMDGPYLISDKWKDGPNVADAAAHGDTTGLTVFFQYDKVWIYDKEDKLLPGFPMFMNKAFRMTVSWFGQSIPEEMKTYLYFNLVLGDAMNHTRSETVANQFNTTAAFHYKNNYYFFSWDDYYKVDVNNYQIVEADPPYPRKVADYWFGCGDEKFTDDEL